MRAADVNRGKARADGDPVAFVEFHALGVDEAAVFLRLQAHAALLHAEQARDAEALADGDHMHGGRGEADDGVHLTHDGRIRGQEGLLAEADFFSLALGGERRPAAEVDAG